MRFSGLLSAFGFVGFVALAACGTTIPPCATPPPPPLVAATDASPPPAAVFEDDFTTRPDHPSETVAPILSRLPPQVQQNVTSGGSP
jgi:hypothetical protein